MPNVIERHNVKIWGDGEKAIIFAHGYGCDQTMWRHIVPAFTEKYQAVLFDHVGAGGSNLAAYNRTKYGTLQGYADDIVRLCRDLDLEKSIFVGHSVGATIGILAALSEPKLFERLVLVAPSPCYLNDEGYAGGFSREQIDEMLKSLEANFQAWSEKMAPVIMGTTIDDGLAQELAKVFCRNRPEIARHFAQVLFTSDHRKDFAALGVPSLILQCSQDVLAPSSVGEWLHSQMRDSLLVHLKATGHCPHASAPDETVAAIKSYLEGKQARRSA